MINPCFFGLVWQPIPASGVNETQQLEKLVKNVVDKKVERYLQSVSDAFPGNDR